MLTAPHPRAEAALASLFFLAMVVATTGLCAGPNLRFKDAISFRCVGSKFNNLRACVRVFNTIRGPRGGSAVIVVRGAFPSLSLTCKQEGSFAILAALFETSLWKRVSLNNKMATSSSDDDSDGKRTEVNFSLFVILAR